MDITIDKIDTIRERKNVSYEKAKKALEQTNGDVVEAIVWLEGQTEETKETTSQTEKEEKKQQTSQQTTTAPDNNIMEYLKYDLSFKKNNIDKFSLPIWLFLIIFLFAHELVIIALIIALLTKHKIYINKENS